MRTEIIDILRGDLRSIDLVMGKVIEISAPPRNPDAPTKYRIKDSSGEIDLALYSDFLKRARKIGMVISVGDELSITNTYYKSWTSERNGKTYPSISLQRVFKSGDDGGDIEIVQKTLEAPKNDRLVQRVEDREDTIEVHESNDKMDKLIHISEKILEAIDDLYRLQEKGSPV